MSPSLPYAADVESPLKPEELQVLRAQYEKEGEYVGLQTKFNYAWGLIKSNSRPDQQEGVRLLSEIFRNSRERRRECLYYLALGNYKLGNYAEARRYNELLLELEPANLQAGSLKGLIDEKVAKEGLSSNQPAPAQPQAPAHRDMMFCHQCADEWYRDQHGLTCPECHSDFTEIIEDNNDPRDSVMFADDDGDDDDSMPSLEESTPHLDPRSNPWANDDPAEDDISNLQWTQTAPGRYNVHATITRSVSPQQFRATGGMPVGPIGGFMSMLNGITRAATQGQGPQPQGQGEGLFSGPNQNQDRTQNQSAFQEARAQGGDGQPRVSRFTYTSGGARMDPSQEDMTNMITGLMATFGALPGNAHVHAHHRHHHPMPGVEVRVGADHFHDPDHPHDHPHDEDMGAINPLFQLLRSVGVVPPGTRMGDFVSSQEGLDRIISQLMEQTATSNAPGPATEADIDNLPRKKVDETMLGDEHKAECSICMDEVNIGEEVTVLPCKHWFHHACVSAWLLEHDTCPHCRKGITKQQEGQSNNPSSSESTQAGGARQMPGAFDASGLGS
ncbi:hypothetical protein CC86DRAFT_397625 [Ophiobolus disseminans]|uniref:Mitochondrial fission 1 protein n=1 Tax=Ophiobolus disseminans TaxID=1469910 RepID=A0A6A6ZJ85_9PLEO|nr:hypothetical protein CC86DRAFT_397625 [Ophiobolus disseminans]